MNNTIKGIVAIVILAVAAVFAQSLDGSQPATTPVAAKSMSAPVTVSPLLVAKTLAKITPALSPARYKASATTPVFRDLSRNTESYTGEVITYNGKVLQVLESRPWFADSIVYTLRLAIDADYETVIVAKLTYADGTGWRPLADDNVTIWGTVEGRQEYETIMGEQVVLPSIVVEYIKLQ